MLNELILSKINFFFDDESKKDLIDIFNTKNAQGLSDDFSVGKDTDDLRVVIVNKLNVAKFHTKSNNTLYFAIEEDSLLDQMTTLDGENIFLISNSIVSSELDSFIELYFGSQFLSLKRECLNKGYKRTVSLLKEVEYSKISATIMGKLIDFEKALYCSLNRSEMINIFFDYLTENLEGEFCLFRDFEADFTLMEDDIFVFGLRDEYYYLSFEKSEKNIIFVSLFITSIFNLLSIEIEEGLGDGLNLEFNWSDVYDLLPVPTVMIDSFGSIRKYNKRFLDLTLTSTQCAGFINNQDVSLKGDIYKIRKIEGIDNEKTLIYFLKDSYIGSKEIAPSNEELGIISSSLAHELNNPLGGILAAISLMELDENSTEVSQQLDEMKKSAKRCKQLVETFLGFSRALPQNYSSVDNVLENTVESNVYKAFTQANDLIRFRLIENNLMMNFTHSEDQGFNKEINPSIWAMIIYLIYGEVITTFQHLQLVDSSYKNMKNINCELIESKSEVLLDFNIANVVDELDLDSGLIAHLMENEKITIQKQGGQILIKPRDAFLEI
jgi:signal transduction histidine kinase